MTNNNTNMTNATNNDSIEQRLMKAMARELNVDITQVFQALITQFDGDKDAIAQYVSQTMEVLKDEDRQKALEATGLCVERTYSGRWEAMNHQLQPWKVNQIIRKYEGEKTRTPCQKWREEQKTVKAAEKLGWKQMPLWRSDKECKWIQVGPVGESFKLSWCVLSKDPNSWFDISSLGLNEAPEWLMPWLQLANKHKVLKFATMWQRDPLLVSQWLQAKRPSRKALEKTLPKFVAGLPTEYNWGKRPVPDFIEYAGGWHCRNEEELRNLGAKNGWCFGSGHHATYTTNIQAGDELFFIPHKEGLIAAHRKQGIWAEIRFPHNEDASETLDVLIEDYESDFRTKAAEDRIWAEAEHYWDLTGY